MEPNGQKHGDLRPLRCWFIGLVDRHHQQDSPILAPSRCRSAYDAGAGMVSPAWDLTVSHEDICVLFEC